MTCFWTGLMKCLTPADYQFLRVPQPLSELEFVTRLKRQNKPPTSVIWQQQRMSTQLIQESTAAVAAFDASTINRGYWCSTCDPFILLTSELFRVNIHHRFCSHLITYTVSNARKTLYVTSDTGHFQMWKAPVSH